jgi:hypothetical protein
VVLDSGAKPPSCSFIDASNVLPFKLPSGSGCLLGDLEKIWDRGSSTQGGEGDGGRDANGWRRACRAAQ